MIETLKRYANLFDAREPRERALLLLTIMVVLAYAWWWIVGQPLLSEVKQLQQQNTAIEAETRALSLSAAQIEKRIQQGVHKSKQDRIEQLGAELRRVERILQEKTIDLIEPDDMFTLMQEMITRESKLQLTRLQRTRVSPVFEQAEAEEESQIYRHVMSVKFVGSFADILDYVGRLERLPWKLIWDRIHLQTEEYPRIEVEIEISTLSDSQHWVGL